MKKIIAIIGIAAFILAADVSLAGQKEKADPIVSSENIVYLKNKYTPDEVNYFYEIMFFLEHPSRKADNLHKWKKTGELYVGIDQGHNIWNDDYDLVQNAVNEINTLDLPFKLILKNSFKSRIFFQFRDFKYFQKKWGLTDPETLTAPTRVSVVNDTGRAIIAIIDVFNNDYRYGKMSPEISKGIRQFAILQELTQALGPSGDSWHYKNSVFSDDSKIVYELCDMDRRIVQMLYEPCIPLGYRRTQFEKDFADILYHIDAPQKIAAYVKENDIPLSLLETLRSYMNNDREDYTKFPTYGYVRLPKGSCSVEDAEFIRKAVALINTSTDKFQLEITDSEIMYSTPSIDFAFEDIPLGTKIEYNWNRNDDIDYMFPYIEYYKLTEKKDNRHYSSSREAKDHRNKNLFKMLYQGIMSLDRLGQEDVITISEDGEFSFRPGYSEMLALMYEPVFWSGMPVSEIDEAIEILKHE